MDPHLEPGVALLEQRMNSERFIREMNGLGATKAIPLPSWITYGSEPFTVPILALSDPSDDSIILHDYFARAIKHVPSEVAAVALLDHPETADEPLRAYAEAGAGARRRFDVEQAIQSIDITRLMEEYLHDTSDYGRSVFELYSTYQALKATCSNETLEAHVELAIDLGEEIIASNALRFERINTVGTHFGREVQREDTSPSQAILIDIANMIRCPLVQTPFGIAVPENADTMLEAIDRFSTASELYAAATREAITETLERDPGRIAHADAYARTPGTWIQTIS